MTLSNDTCLVTFLNIAWARKAYEGEGYGGPVNLKRLNEQRNLTK